MTLATGANTEFEKKHKSNKAHEANNAHGNPRESEGGVHEEEHVVRELVAGGDCQAYINYINMRGVVGPIEQPQQKTLSSSS